MQYVVSFVEWDSNVEKANQPLHNAFFFLL